MYLFTTRNKKTWSTCVIVLEDTDGMLVHLVSLVSVCSGIWMRGATVGLRCLVWMAGMAYIARLALTCTAGASSFFSFMTNSTIITISQTSTPSRTPTLITTINQRKQQQQQQQQQQHQHQRRRPQAFPGHLGHRVCKGESEMLVIALWCSLSFQCVVVIL